MTVVDSSAVIDCLAGEGAADSVADLIAHEPAVAAPDVLVYEVLAVLRRHVARGRVDSERARAGELHRC